MALTYVGVGTAAAGNNASLTPALPSGWAVDDLLLVYVSSRGNGTWTAPTGWTQIFQVAHSSSGINKIACFYKFAVSDEVAPAMTYSGGASGQTTLAQVCAFRGSIPNSPVDILGSASSNSSATNIGPISGITTTSGNGVIIVFGHRADDWTSVATLSGDSLTWVEIGEPDTTSGNDAGQVWDYALFSSNVTVTSKTFTVSGGSAQTGLGIMLSIAENSSINKTIVDVVSAKTDSAILVFNYLSEKADSIALTDAVVTALGYGVSKNDAISRADSIASLFGIAASAIDTLNILDNVKLLNNYLSSQAEVLNIADIINLQLNNNLRLVDTLTLSDITARLLNYYLNSTDSFITADTIKLLVNVNLVSTDILNILDSVNLILESSSNEYVVTKEDILILNDATSIVLFVILRISKSDSLIFADIRQPQIAEPLEYYRRYLNAAE